MSDTDIVTARVDAGNAYSIVLEFCLLELMWGAVAALFIQLTALPLWQDALVVLVAFIMTFTSSVSAVKRRQAESA